MMVTVKIGCVCGQRYAFEVEPIGDRMPSPVACPVCGADGTGAANEAIAQRLAAQAAVAAPPAGGAGPRAAIAAPRPSAAPGAAVPTARRTPGLGHETNSRVAVARGGRCAVFRDATRVAIPAVCVVCGEPAAAFVAYTQDHLPVTLPGIAFMRWTNVKAPYCARHAYAFERRFKVLRRVQGILYVLVIIALTMTLMEPLRALLGLPPKPGPIAFAILGIVFCGMVSTIFIVKPRL